MIIKQDNKQNQNLIAHQRANNAEVSKNWYLERERALWNREHAWPLSCLLEHWELPRV